MDPPSSDTTRAASNPVAPATTAPLLERRDLSPLPHPNGLSRSRQSFQPAVDQRPKSPTTPQIAPRSRLQTRCAHPLAPHCFLSPSPLFRRPRHHLAAEKPHSPYQIRPPASLSSDQLRSRKPAPHDPAHDSFFSLATRRGSDGSLSSSSTTFVDLHKRSHSPVSNTTYPLSALRSLTSRHRSQRVRSDFIGPEAGLCLSIQPISYNSQPRNARLRWSAPREFPSAAPDVLPASSLFLQPLHVIFRRWPVINQFSRSHLASFSPHVVSTCSFFRLEPPRPAHTRQHTYDPSLHQQHILVGNSLKAFITAPPPLKSPPLRNSRLRPPVSSASTAASRARSGQRFESSLASQNNDPARFRKKKIPELDNINLAARKEKIQRAFSDKSADAPGRSSLSGSDSRRGSNVNDPPVMNEKTIAQWPRHGLFVRTHRCRIHRHGTNRNRQHRYGCVRDLWSTFTNHPRNIPGSLSITKIHHSLPSC